MCDSNKKLIKNLRKRNVKSFEYIFKEYHGMLVLFADKYIKDIDSSRDIVQDVFEKFWDNSKSLDINVSIKPYLFQAVKNRSLNYLRHIGVVDKSYDKLKGIAIESSGVLNFDDNDTFKTVLSNELKEKIDEILSDLPDKYSSVYKMSRFSALKNKEIAEVLGISEKTVEKHITKVTKIMREKLKDFL